METFVSRETLDQIRTRAVLEMAEKLERLQKELEQAQAEAERLAKLTGKQVIILKSYLEVMVDVKTRTYKN